MVTQPYEEHNHTPWYKRKCTRSIQQQAHKGSLNLTSPLRFWLPKEREIHHPIREELSRNESEEWTFPSREIFWIKPGNDLDERVGVCLVEQDGMNAEEIGFGPSDGAWRKGRDSLQTLGWDKEPYKDPSSLAYIEETKISKVRCPRAVWRYCFSASLGLARVQGGGTWASEEEVAVQVWKLIIQKISPLFYILLL